MEAILMWKIEHKDEIVLFSKWKDVVDYLVSIPEFESVRIVKLPMPK
jgi:hypothetical protein